VVHRKIDRVGEKRRYRERETGEKERHTQRHKDRMRDLGVNFKTKGVNGREKWKKYQLSLIEKSTI
jgi:hypothetical protein